MGGDEGGTRKLDGGMNSRKEGSMRRSLEEKLCRKKNEEGRGRKRNKLLGLEIEEAEKKRRELGREKRKEEWKERTLKERR